MHRDEKHSIIIPLLLLVILYCFSIIFFHFIEGWSYLDAAYFTTSTISTVGYGDVTPETEYGKIGSIILTFVGVGLALYVITHLGILREKKVDPHVRRRLEVLRSFTMHATGMEDGELTKLKKKIREREERK
jgi:voltage-gated potassium channel